ncbi:SDR family NAD(P)-dependent oxidoreductase [Kutzneria sp. CA-103260]|uniref:SDR family NAD(P)-dependent oxidoreductase n=1 Tax=Kutzneria sp. CA-103260 TaxID=2802641 RepID=UPI001BA5992C|nr:SDR family NAD(P)-dependent oxidoreductase [Kutzneria sp. CA-103260]QUQ64090.1 short chain dehydrogenase [Kutzneria sp. CA-103260]
MIEYRARWGVVTGASSGFGELFAQRLAERGMSLVLTGRDHGRLTDVAVRTRRLFPDVEIETATADLASDGGVEQLLSQVGDRPVEVLVNNAGFGTYGPFTTETPERMLDEVAVDVTALVGLTRALLPGMVERGSGGVLNVASTIAFQPSPYQAVYGASKAFVLSFSQALRAEARPHGVAVVALCPGPTRTGFVAALDANVSGTRIYRRLAEPGPVVDLGLRALDRNRSVAVSGWRNRIGARMAPMMPRDVATAVAERLLAPAGSAATRPPIDVTTEVTIDADIDDVWRVLTTVDEWPTWYRACRWVRSDGAGGGPVGPGATFTWKAHPVTLDSTVLAADPRRVFSFRAVARGLSAIHTVTLHPTPQGVRVVSHETQTGPLPSLARWPLAAHLRASNTAWLRDLAGAVGGPGHDSDARPSRLSNTSASPH